jgi:uncharacterized protein YoxC
VEFPIVVNIAIVIGFLSLSALCIYLIFTLSKLRETLDTLQKDIQEISRNTLPVLDNLKIITDKFRNISENVDDQIGILRTSVESIREVVDNIVSFEYSIQEKIEGPVMEAFSFIAAVVKGFKAFAQKLKS